MHAVARTSIASAASAADGCDLIQQLTIGRLAQPARALQSWDSATLGTGGRRKSSSTGGGGGGGGSERRATGSRGSVSGTGTRSLVLGGIAPQETATGRLLLEQRHRGRQQRQLVADTGLPALARLGSRGEQPRPPPLMIRLRERLDKELASASSDDARMRVYAEVFGLFIEGFESYAPVLERVKGAYDDRVSYCALLRERVSELEATLALRTAEADDRIGRALYETDALVGETNVRTRAMRSKLEDVMISQQAMLKENTELTEKLDELVKERARERQEAVRLRTALSHLGDICEDVKAKQATAKQYYELQTENLRVQISQLAYHLEGAKQRMEAVGLVVDVDLSFLDMPVAGSGTSEPPDSPEPPPPHVVSPGPGPPLVSPTAPVPLSLMSPVLTDGNGVT